ncbi:MAG: type II secretion system F family protein [Nanoarchaeota archaeon]|nr:type II secretion system F family protein [Nanoarchaeota archaeon]
MLENDPKQIAKRISDLADEIITYKKNKLLILEGLNNLEKDLGKKKISKEDYDKSVQKYLQGKSKDEVIKSHDNYINQLFDSINTESDKVLMIFNLCEIEPAKKKQDKVSKDNLLRLSHKTKQLFMKQVNIDKYFLRLYLRRKKDKEVKDIRVEYQLYEQKAFGRFANRLFGSLSQKLISSSPKIFKSLFQSLRMSGLKILSKTYVSMIFLISLLAFMLVSPLAALFFHHPVFTIQLSRGILLGLLASGIAAAIAFFYPNSLAKQKSTAIKNDLPFMIIHMAAVAGSGAKPISMFKTILFSGEYPALRGEVKKIVNYVTLFGYNLSTALKAVAKTTASIRFKDMLDSIIANIESGGDMKDFLEAMADEAMTTYRLERKMAVQSIATYSDIYTAVLIAAPLLFFVTLAIIQTLGGTIAGLSVGTIAKVGTYGVIPALNLGFLVFLNMVAPK